MAFKFFNTGEIIRDNFGQEFCFIPEGNFVGGEDAQEEMEIHAPFYMGRSPMTMALFQAFLQDTNYDYPAEDLAVMHEVSPMPDCPAVNISWLDAKEICRWLRKKTGHYYSLPQNDEWEKAARGEDGRKFPWGDASPSDELACFNQLEAKTTSQITGRLKGASPYGCLDMAGNVWEWCIDSFDDERDPHILKGGSWQNPEEFLETGLKTFSFPPEKRQAYMGIRLLYLPQGEMLEYYQGAYKNK
jgi:formylglycine-generating enzyme required for sulfatase activity